MKAAEDLSVISGLSRWRRLSHTIFIICFPRVLSWGISWGFYLGGSFELDLEMEMEFQCRGRGDDSLQQHFCVGTLCTCVGVSLHVCMCVGKYVWTCIYRTSVWSVFLETRAFLQWASLEKWEITSDRWGTEFGPHRESLKLVSHDWAAIWGEGG